MGRDELHGGEVDPQALSGSRSATATVSLYEAPASSPLGRSTSGRAASVPRSIVTGVLPPASTFSRVTVSG